MTLSSTTLDIAVGGEEPIWPVPDALRPLYSIVCLYLTLFIYWPVVMIRDMSRGTLLGRVLHGSNDPFVRNPQYDVDGPEFVLGAPRRKLYLYNRGKSGHRGFLQSLLGATAGAALDALVDRLWSLPASAKPHARSAGDISTSADTLLMRGVVRDRATGHAVRDAVLHAWQADPRASLDSTAKYGDLDLDYDFRGSVEADKTSGAYDLVTMYPVSISALTSASVALLINTLLLGLPSLYLLYKMRVRGEQSAPLRPPHIHFYVVAPGYHTLTTQIYFPDRLAPGEFDQQLSRDVAHPTPATPVRPAIVAHPTLVDARQSMTSDVPRTKWILNYDFNLERK